jgi:uncharacterized 2Fe-2S/4Fe-4S cluster protein (DUF4445 family)
MIVGLAAGRAESLTEVVLVGNTVMHHLFAGIDVEPLSHAPFQPRDGNEKTFRSADLGWSLPPSCRIRFLPCLGGFIGSDISAGIIAVNLAGSDQLEGIIDLGTNGEVAIGSHGRILAASTAAGPAFEASSIRMGMRAAPGAISHVFVEGDALDCRVIGDAPPRGICGSGLVDAVAAGLEVKAIRPDGRLVSTEREFPLTDAVSISQADIRELQLAKAAVACGLRLLLRRLGAKLEDIKVMRLAGAFGNYVRTSTAVRIGLLEIAPCRIEAAGNTALRGAKMILLDPHLTLPDRIEHVALASEPGFQETFLECLQFPEM